MKNILFVHGNDEFWIRVGRGYLTMQLVRVVKSAYIAKESFHLTHPSFTGDMLVIYSSSSLNWTVQYICVTPRNF